MIFLYNITRFPQASFEGKVVSFSFLNSVFINIWPRCTFLYIAFDFQSGFFGNFSFSLCWTCKMTHFGQFAVKVSRGLQRCPAWISASQAFKMEEFYCFRLCSYSFTVRLFNYFIFTVISFFFLSFFFKSGCWLVSLAVFWGGCFEFLFEFYLFVGVRSGEGFPPPPPRPPKYINLFIFTVGVNYYIWQWVWMFIHKKILLFVSVSLFEACLYPSEKPCALPFYWVQYRRTVQGILS